MKQEGVGNNSQRIMSIFHGIGTFMGLELGATSDGMGFLAGNLLFYFRGGGKFDSTEARLSTCWASLQIFVGSRICDAYIWALIVYNRHDAV